MLFLLTDCHLPEGKAVVNIHDPTGLPYLFQLRSDLSPLRSHIDRYGCSDTSSDICLGMQGTKDTHHFSFTCPFDSTKRAVVISS